MHQYDPNRLRQHRQALGKRPEQLAVDLDRSVRTITLWEQGRVNPNPHQLARLADALNCTIGDFFEVAE